MLAQLYNQAREALLNIILGVDPSNTLNHSAVGLMSAVGEASPAEDLKRILNQIKAQAISPDGREVNYPALARSQVYQQYRVLAAGLSTFDYRMFSASEERLAFWINLYNSLVIDAVIQGSVQKSLTESWLRVMGFFQKAAYQINGQRFSLTDIEHGVLRANRGFPFFPGRHFSSNDPRIEAVLGILDPRIHFALNCASRSCPPIGIYSADNIDQQLDLAASSFINADTVVDVQTRTISLSRIFYWYAGDFGGKKGTLAFVTRFLLPPVDKSWDQDLISQLRIRYHEYDWGLNKTQPNA